MKATINEHGVLEIKAENALESYALNRWIDDNFSNPNEGAINTKNISINIGFNKEES